MNFEVGKFYKTRSGKKAEIRLTDVKTTQGENLLVRINNQDWLMYSDGYFYNNRTKHDFDLIREWQEPHKIEGWMNVYSGGNSRVMWKNKKDAIKHGSDVDGYIATIYVSGVEGVEPDGT